MNPYPKYKPAEIRWIDKIPEHWSIKPLFAVFRENKLQNRDNHEENVLSLSYGKIIRRDLSQNFGLIPDSFETYQIISPGYIVLRLTDLQNDKKSLRVGLVKEKGIITSAYTCLISSSEVIAEFAYYLFHAYDITKVFYNEGAGVRQSMNFKDLRRMPVLIPPISEQLAIAHYLNRKTAQIDTLIAKKQCQIELLKEQRIATISQAVTKGLNNSVSMKDTGIEWLGSIPLNWRAVPLKNVCYMKGRIGWQGLKQGEFIEEGPFLITGMNFLNGKMNWDNCYHISEARYAEAPEIHVEKGDILITKDGTIGKLLYIDYLPGPTSLNSHLLILRPLNNEYVSKYLYYLLQSGLFQRFVENVKTGTTFYGISQEQMGNFRILMSNVSEQQEIVDYLDNSLGRIDKLIGTFEQQIDLYKRFRTALISEAVTGKIDVRGEA